MATITALGIGSGLDLTGLLDQLEAAERQKLVPITQQKQSYQSKISAYGVLQNALNQFQSAADKLKDSQLFSAVKSSVTGSSVTAASGSETAAGVYQIDVAQLATHYSVATAGVDDKSTQLGAGTIEFTLGDGTVFSVAIEDGKSSLEDIRNAINAAGEGVSASIVNDGDPDSPWRLALAASETGTDAAFSVTFDGVGLAKDDATEIAAENAQLTVNGITIISQGNQVEGAIEGVTLALAEEGMSTLRIEQDNESMTEAVKGFVSAYNTLQSTISRLTSYNAESGAAGDTGFASKLSDALELMTRDGGVIDNAKKGLQTSISSLDTRYARMEQSIGASIARYRAQFAQLDSMIASMNSTSAYLTQQFRSE